MAGYSKGKDGKYRIPIVDLGTRLQNNFGLTIKEHPAFDKVDKVHSDNSYHYHDLALDIQDWRGGAGKGDEGFNGVGYVQRTKNLRDLLKGSGVEVIGPGDMAGHESHLHLATDDGFFNLDENQYNYLFGGNAGGKLATFSGFDSTPISTPVSSPVQMQADDAPSAYVAAKEKAMNYSTMSKAELDSAYDKLRADDPDKALAEGLKMHKAYFNK